MKEFKDWLILKEFQDSLVEMDEKLYQECVAKGMEPREFEIQELRKIQEQEMAAARARGHTGWRAPGMPGSGYVGGTRSRDTAAAAVGGGGTGGGGGSHAVGGGWRGERTGFGGGATPGGMGRTPGFGAAPAWRPGSVFVRASA